MTEFHLPWMVICVIIPLVGAAAIFRERDVETAQKGAVGFCGLTLVCTIFMWLDFKALNVREVTDRWHALSSIVGEDGFIVDSLSAPLLPLMALVYLATAMSTLRTKVRRFSFSRMLIAESLQLAMFSCRNPGEIIVLLATGILPRLWELRERGKPTRVFALHMGLLVLLLTAGWTLTRDPHGSMFGLGVFLLAAGVLIRAGCVPVHVWMTDLFEHASFGTALLFVSPMVGAYAMVRLVLPIAPDWALHAMAAGSLVTSVYAAGMAIVQKEARRFFCYLALSHSSLVMVGLTTVDPIGLTGSLAVWLSDAVAMAGLGLTLRSMESRLGRISLASYHGMYEHTPTLAVFFLLTGLASVGFPGAFGFVGTELLVRGAVTTDPFVGAVVVLAAALNGIAVLAAYFRLFTGVRRGASISLAIRLPERIAVLSLATLMIAGGLFPQSSIRSRYEAAEHLVETRRSMIEPDGSREVSPEDARQPDKVVTTSPER